MNSQEKSDAESAILLEIANLAKELESARKKRNEYKLKQDAVFECLNKKKLNPQLHSKVVDITIIPRVAKSSNLNTKFSLLSTTKSLESPSLTEEEGAILRTAVEECLKEKKTTMFKDLKEVGLTEAEIWGKKNDSEVEHQESTDMKMSLNEKHKLYLTNLTELINIYEQIIQIKFKKMPSAVSDQVDMLKVDTDKLKMRLGYLNSASQVAVFTENANCLQAYDLILKEVCEAQEKCKADIENFKVLKEKHKQVSSKQYDEILKQYLLYKKRVDILLSLE